MLLNILTGNCYLRFQCCAPLVIEKTTLISDEFFCPNISLYSPISIILQTDIDAAPDDIKGKHHRHINTLDDETHFYAYWLLSDVCIDLFLTKIQNSIFIIFTKTHFPNINSQSHMKHCFLIRYMKQLLFQALPKFLNTQRQRVDYCCVFPFQ